MTLPSRSRSSTSFFSWSLIGVSSFGPERDTPASVINAADQALYGAKSRGKNCVEIFEMQHSDPSPRTKTGETGKQK